jgi:hypothetical protein
MIISNRTGLGGQGGSSSGFPASGGWGGLGGGLYSESLLLLTNCTLVGNSCGNGGLGGFFFIVGNPFGRADGGPGGYGGGLCTSATNQAVAACTIVNNAAGLGGPGELGGERGPDGQGGGVCSASDGARGGFLNTIVARNTGQAPDVSGVFHSLGYNLIGVTNGSSGFASPGDMNGSSVSPIDPKLAPLADNGGPTLTIALLSDSPAINAGATLGAPATDQRGIARPQGSGVDIGAYEFQFTRPQISNAKLQSFSSFWLRAQGLPNQTYTVQASTNLPNWFDLMNVLSDSNGVAEFVDTNLGNGTVRFYRLKLAFP